MKRSSTSSRDTDDNPHGQSHQFGERGDAPSTKRGSVVAINCFCDWYGKQILEESIPQTEKHLPSLKTLGRAELCDISLLRRYGDYLAKECLSKTSGNLITMGTATTYLSGIVSELRYKYPQDPIWDGITDIKVAPRWYSNIIKKIEDEVHIRCAAEGVPVVKKILGTGRVLMKGIGEHIPVMKI